MNKKQRCVIWLGLIVFVLVSIFPPCLERDSLNKKFVSYHFIFKKTPILSCTGDRIVTTQEIFDPSIKLSSPQIYIPHLFLEWVFIAVITLSVLISFKNKQSV